jgi:hypothetical protein
MYVIGHFQAAPLCPQKKNVGTIRLRGCVCCTVEMEFWEKINILRPTEGQTPDQHVYSLLTVPRSLNKTATKPAV